MKNFKQLVLISTSLFLLSSCDDKVSTSNTSVNSTPPVVSTTPSIVSNTPSISESKSSVESDIQTSTTTVSESSFEAYSMTLNSGQTFNYYLYTPKDVKENSSFILYLHGGSGKATTANGDLTLLTEEDGLPKFVKEKQIEPDSYMIFPQLPYRKTGWGDVKNDVITLCEDLMTTLKCDKTKFSMTGHSMGGKGTWDLALASPDTFYKVAPLSGAVKVNDANIDKLKNTPIWAIVGSDDTIVDPSSSIQFITKLKEVNTEAKLTVIDGYDHFDVLQAYLSTEYNLLSWLVE